MKRTRSVESDSVKSARKTKNKLHKDCERASEIREQTLHRQEQNSAHGKHRRVTRQSSQHTSTITCTTGLLHYSTSKALLMGMALLYNTEHLSIGLICAVFLALTQLRYK